MRYWFKRFVERKLPHTAMSLRSSRRLFFLFDFKRITFNIIQLFTFFRPIPKVQGPVVQSVASLTSSLRVISLTVLAD